MAGSGPGEQQNAGLRISRLAAAFLHPEEFLNFSPQGPRAIHWRGVAGAQEQQKEGHMASFQIVAVRTESSADGSHEHISEVKTSGGNEWSRESVVKDIRDGS